MDTLTCTPTVADVRPVKSELNEPFKLGQHVIAKPGTHFYYSGMRGVIVSDLMYGKQAVCFFNDWDEPENPGGIFSDPKMWNLDDLEPVGGEQ